MLKKIKNLLFNFKSYFVKYIILSNKNILYIDS